VVAPIETVQATAIAAVAVFRLLIRIGLPSHRAFASVETKVGNAGNPGLSPRLSQRYHGAAPSRARYPRGFDSGCRAINPLGGNGLKAYDRGAWSPRAPPTERRRELSAHTTETEPSDPSPGDLLEGVARGDWASWREIVRRYEPLVRHTARRAGLGPADASDAAQQTWVLLWKHAHQIREPQHLAAWLVVAARREAVRLATASNRYVLCADPETEYTSPERHGVLDAYPSEGDYDGAVAQALNRLPSRLRSVLMLATSNQCPTYAEIAERLRLPIGSVGPMRMRALERLANTPEFRTGHARRPVLVKAAA
jgi:RNA polymerase sigma factor (sigma-70 family)